MKEEVTGVACECSKCKGPQWYDHGICKGCNSSQEIKYTWIARQDKNDVPNKIMRLKSGASSKLVDLWKNLLLVRGLTPYLQSNNNSSIVVQYSSADWYKIRGVNFTVQCPLPIDPEFVKKINKASAWTNESFVVRIITTFEAFLLGDNDFKRFKLPNVPGMREFHHAKYLRNKIVHSKTGEKITNTKLIKEVKQIFGPMAVVDGSYNFDISIVIEPLWARLLLYARSIEDGVDETINPAVVVASDDTNLFVQTFHDIKQLPKVDEHIVGDVISLSNIK